MMPRFILIALAAALLSVSCSSNKPKPDAATQQGATEGVVDPNIENKNIAYDLQGSDSGKIAGLNTVYFEFDRSELNADAKKKLAENAAWIKSNADVTVQIEGHCDKKGSIEYNIALGERRATSVKNYLAGLGVEGKRLTIISYGKEKPIDNGDSDSAMAKNRRANFVPLPK